MNVSQMCQKLAKVSVAFVFGEFPVSIKLCTTKTYGNLSTTTYRNRSSLRGTPKPFPTCPPVSIPKGGGRGGAPPLPKSIPFQLKSIPWGGGYYLLNQSFRGGRGGRGGGGVKGPFL